MTEDRNARSSFCEALTIVFESVPKEVMAPGNRGSATKPSWPARRCEQRAVSVGVGGLLSFQTLTVPKLQGARVLDQLHRLAARLTCDGLGLLEQLEEVVHAFRAKRHVPCAGSSQSRRALGELSNSMRTVSPTLRPNSWLAPPRCPRHRGEWRSPAPHVVEQCHALSVEHRVGRMDFGHIHA